MKYTSFLLFAFFICTKSLHAQVRPQILDFQNELIYEPPVLNLNHLNGSKAWIGEMEPKEFSMHLPYGLSYVYLHPQLAITRVHWVLDKEENSGFFFTEAAAPTHANVKCYVPQSLLTIALADKRALEKNTFIQQNYMQSSYQQIDYLKQRYADFEEATLDSAVPYYPESYNSFGFIDFVKRLVSDVGIMAYSDSNFTQGLTANEAKERIQKLETNGYTVHIFEDYFTHPITQKTIGEIVGLELKSNSSNTFNLWIKYTDIQPFLYNKVARIGDVWHNQDYILENHLFTGSIQGIYNPTPVQPSYHVDDAHYRIAQWPAIYLALYKMQNLLLIKEEGNLKIKAQLGLPAAKFSFMGGALNGPFQMGSKKEILFKGSFVNDSLDGELLVYHKGKVLAHRNYQKGQLEGKQHNYHSNGMPFVVFDASLGAYTALRKYNPEGELIEGGKFQNRAPFGLWEYHLTLSPKVLEWIDPAKVNDEILPGFDGISTFHLKINYWQEADKSCIYKNDECFRMEYVLE